MRAGALALAALCAGGAGLAAQDVRLAVGELKDTRTLSADSQCLGVATSAAPEIRLRRQGAVLTARPGTRIIQNDGISKSSSVLARLDVDAVVGGRGTLFLVPTIGCFPGLRGSRFPGEIPHSLSSEYRFATRALARSGPDLRRTLALVLDRGAVIVHWEGGAPLVVVLPFDSVQVIGTTVSIAVDSTRTNGLLYVHEGSVFVPSLERTLTGGELLRWGAAGPVVRRAEPGESGPLESASEYYTQQAWRSPGNGSWRKWAAGAAGTIAAGALIYTLTRDGGEGGPRSGTVIVRLPGFRR